MQKKRVAMSRHQATGSAPFHEGFGAGAWPMRQGTVSMSSPCRSWRRGSAGLWPREPRDSEGRLPSRPCRDLTDRPRLEWNDPGSGKRSPFCNQVKHIAFSAAKYREAAVYEAMLRPPSTQKVPLKGKLASRTPPGIVRRSGQHSVQARTPRTSEGFHGIGC